MINCIELKKLLFAPETCNLAETTRMIEIAKACKTNFEVLFISYGGLFEELITNEGFNIKYLQPRLTEKKTQHLNAITKGESFGRAFTSNEINARIKGEIELCHGYKPTAIITGYCASIPVSARISKIPLVWVSQTTWLREFYTEGWIVNDIIKYKILSKFIGRLYSVILIAHSNYIFLSQANKILRKHGLATFKSVFDFWKGDFNLLAEPEGFSQLKSIPSTYRFIGPLLGRQFKDIPNEITNIAHDKPIVYFAMGSVGKPSIIAKIILAFKDKPYTVIAPVKKHLDKLNIDIPKNVFVTNWLPAHLVNSIADISIIHGGIGSIMNACLAGKPLIGIGMQFEQDGNLSCVVRKGFAKRFNKLTFTERNIMNALEELLKNEVAKDKAKQYKLDVEKWNGPEMAAKFLSEKFNK